MLHVVETYVCVKICTWFDMHRKVKLWKIADLDYSGQLVA